MKQNKRVAIISDTAPPYGGGGIASAHFNLFRALRARGYQVELFTFFDERSVLDKSTNLEEEELIHRNAPPKVLLKLLRTINGWIFGMIDPGQNAWNFVDILSSSIGVWRTRRDLARFSPQVVILPDHGAPALYLKKPDGVRIGLIAHHNPARFLGEPLLGRYSRLDARLAVWLENVALRKVDRVICTSRHMHSWFRRTYRYTGPLRVIPNVTDPRQMDKINPKDLHSKLELPPDSPLIAIPAATLPLKGSHMVREIIHGICGGVTNQVGFYLGGNLDTQLTQELRQLPKNAIVHAPGRLSNDDYLSHLLACSFGIFPALRDNYSMSLVEATTGGIPMIAFDAGGNADIIENGKNGYLIPAFDINILVSQGLRLINQPETLIELRESTRRLSTAKFDPDKIVQEYIDYFIED